MSNKIIKAIRSKKQKNSEFEMHKRLMLGMLKFHNHCISYNKKQDIPIWNYMLSEDKTNLFVFDEDDNTIYDDLVIKAPDYLFKHGEMFSVVEFRGIILEENIVSRKNFYLFQEQYNEVKENK